MQIKMLKKAAFNGKRHEAGEIFDAEKGMGEHLISRGLAVALTPLTMILVQPISTPEPPSKEEPILAEPVPTELDEKPNKRKGKGRG